MDSDARYGNAETKILLDEALQTLSRADAVVHSVDLSGMGVREQYNQLPETSTATRDASGRESLGFIAAETIAYADLVALGSHAKAREVGKLRIEGKEYVVKDGDVIEFRFNV